MCVFPVPGGPHSRSPRDRWRLPARRGFSVARGPGHVALNPVNGALGQNQSERSMLGRSRKASRRSPVRVISMVITWPR